MSNKKRRIEENLITEKQELDKNKLLLELKQELEDLDKSIKKSNRTNAKAIALRSFKIGARFLQLLAPYVVSAGLIFGFFTLLKITPFVVDKDRKAYASVMTEYDNVGNFREERDYYYVGEYQDMIYIYNKWEPKEDGLYTRMVKEYKIKDKTPEDIKALYDMDDTRIEEELGKPISTKYETKNNVLKEELTEERIIKAVINTKDSEDFIYRDENGFENFLTSFCYVIVIIFAGGIIFKIRSDFSSFDFEECVDSINTQHPLANTSEIRRTLEIKRDNYNRLTR